ncbi:hypothetical protein ACTXT7_012693 [Hymenolepis weldensis]
MTASDIEKATAKDSVLKKVMKYVRTGPPKSNQKGDLYRFREGVIIYLRFALKVAEVIPLKSTTTTMLIGSLLHIFSNHGPLETIARRFVDILKWALQNSRGERTMEGVFNVFILIFRVTPRPALNDSSPAKLLWSENPGRSTMLYFQRNRPPLVHLHAPIKLLQPTQQFTRMIIGRMTHGQKVSSKLREAAYNMKWISMAKLWCVIVTISVSGSQQNPRN